MRQVPGGFLAALIVAAAGVAATHGAKAAEPVTLILKGHGFTPSEVRAPANERFRIEVTNQDTTPAEFESSALRAEKIVVPGGTITVMAGPLKPGTYRFWDDFHPNTAKGTMIVTGQREGK